MVIEIKEFRSPSPIVDLEQAIGQYILYQLLLKQVDPQREIYLAITTEVYQEIFDEAIGKLVIKKLNLKLIIVDLLKEEIQEWIN
ncbi:element excision factor XisH family protein [Geminocystis sp. CENA526]|uniref:element excision factor XisH family protein n=1 Tax=Geminocystis sp. CENA526 TaxID=1355871 RepID=UPI003D6E2CB0